MAGTFKFELVSPERILMSVEAEQVIVPGAEGQFTVLAGHAPVVSTLLPGIIQVTTPNSKEAIFVRSGFAEVSGELSDVRVLTVLFHQGAEGDVVGHIDSFCFQLLLYLVG